MVDHIVQLRVTRTKDKHVCKMCGKDAYLCGVGYETTTQQLADQFHAELKHARSLEEVRKLPLTSPVTDAIFDATVEEQRLHGPQEHERFYECAHCFSELISAVMGNTSGSLVINWLVVRPFDHAAFCVRKIDAPDRCLLVVGEDPDPLRALEVLKDKNVPHFKTS